MQGEGSTTFGEKGEKIKFFFVKWSVSTGGGVDRFLQCDPKIESRAQQETFALNTTKFLTDFKTNVQISQIFSISWI